MPMLTRTLAALMAIVAISAIAGRPISAAEPITEDRVFLAESDQTEQRYVQIRPASYAPDARHDLLIALHGHGSDRWQYIKDPRGECRAARDAAAKHQMIFVSPDYRARTSWMGPRAETDLLQIIADVKKQHHIGRVFLTSGSMGGTAALSFAAMHPDQVSGVASMNGTANLLEYTQFQEAIRESFGGTKAEVPAEYKRRSAEYWPERLTMPVGITTGGRDMLVPPDSVERLAKVLKLMDRKVMLIRRDTTGHETNYEDSLAILEWVIANDSVIAK